MAQPRVTHRAIKYSPGLNTPVRRVVIHATCGGRGYPGESAAGVAEQTARYFQRPDAGGSAHYVCDLGAEVHTLPDNVIAWHAPPNAGSLGVEICAEGGEDYRAFVGYTRQQWLSAQVWPAVVRAARRVAELCARHELPVRRLTPAQIRAGERGICGHVDVSAAYGLSDHTDPGPAFPWPEFLAAVAGEDERQEDAMDIVSLGMSKPQVITSGKGVYVAWGTEYEDTARVHAAGGAGVLVTETRWCLSDALVRVIGLPAGGRVDLAWVRLSRDGKAIKDVAWSAPTPPADADGLTIGQLGGQFQLTASQQLRLRVLNVTGSGPVTVVAPTLMKLTLLRR